MANFPLIGMGRPLLFEQAEKSTKIFVHQQVYLLRLSFSLELLYYIYMKCFYKNKNKFPYYANGQNRKKLNIFCSIITMKKFYPNLHSNNFILFWNLELYQEKGYFSEKSLNLAYQQLKGGRKTTGKLIFRMDYIFFAKLFAKIIKVFFRKNS